MSIEPEQVFSGARRTISWERIRLGSWAIKHYECLKSFQRIRVGRDGSSIDELRALIARITAQAPDDIQEQERTIDVEIDN